MIGFSLFLMGALFGSLHCLSMCGGIAALVGAASRGKGRGRVLALCGLYQAGRMSTYAFLGILAGAGGARLQEVGIDLPGLQRGLTWFGGGLLIGVGLLLLLGIRLPVRFRSRSDGLCASLWSGLRGTLTSGQAVQTFAAGVWTGFLPCGLVYSALALAVALSDPLLGLYGMLLFGAGTLPSMVGATFLGHAFAGRIRIRLHRLGAVALIVLGVWVALRGQPALDSCCDPSSTPFASHPVEANP